MFITTTLLLAMAMAGLCAPHAAMKTYQKRSNTCRVIGFDNHSNSVTVGPSTTGGASLGQDSRSGIIIEIVNDDGSTTNIFGGTFGDDDNSNPLAIDGQTIPTTSTDLAGDVFYQPSFSSGSQSGCECTYNGATNSGGISGDTFTGVFFNEDDAQCTCEFPCDPPVYAPGRCGVHVIQHQKTDPAVDSYSYDVSLFDNSGVLVGSAEAITIPSQETYDVTSWLPGAFSVKSGNVDADPVGFEYPGFVFDSNNGVCSVGAYDGGVRNMDCSFNC